MPKSNLDSVIGRAIRDNEFRTKMLSDPRSIASEYDLSEGEISQLESVTQDAADQFFNQTVSGGVAGLCSSCSRTDSQ